MCPVLTYETNYCSSTFCRSQWPRGLKRRSAAACLMRLWVRNLPGAWMSVCCECCVLSGRGLCDKLLTRPQGYYRLWCIVVCDLLTSWMRRPWSSGECCAKRKKKVVLFECNHNVTVIYTAPFFEGLSFSIRAVLDFFRGVGRWPKSVGIVIELIFMSLC